MGGRISSQGPFKPEHTEKAFDSITELFKILINQELAELKS